MNAKKIYKTQELVLKVNGSHDPSKLNLRDWERFIDKIVQNRIYQRDAIKSAIIFLASGRYSNIQDLILENSKFNPEINSRYNSLEVYFKNLQIPSILSATIDLATGAGKSYVIYAIAQIALGIGIVDKVIVLTPSVTIKEELTKKFNKLSTDPSIVATIPDSIYSSNPRIINPTETIRDNDICVTNIHAAYQDSRFSIIDSVGFGKGERCLILSDEVHHAYNNLDTKSEEGASIKKWKEFITDKAYGFKYHIGFTGTAYIESEYFNDVIYRFSLRQAIEERFIKSIDYVYEDESPKNIENEKFQKIYQNHSKNRETYSNIKPLTLLITANIKEAKRLKTRLVEFIASQANEGSEETISNNKVLLVTSDIEHKSSVLRLPYVDSKDDKTEWIISVAMLTEGWDVKNVFQIVPMEEKAFNSKLLISQVLGRGLRVPHEYPICSVVVFNHDNWSNKISELVKEVLEIELRLKNSPLISVDRKKYHFSLRNFTYNRKPITISKSTSKVFNYKDTINLTSEDFIHESKTSFINIDGIAKHVVYIVEKEKFFIDDIVAEIVKKFEDLDWEGRALNLNKNQYTQNNLPPTDELKSYIKSSMEKVGITGDFVGKSNYNSILSSFNTLLRPGSKSIVYDREAQELFEIKTINRESESISLLSLRQNSSVFYTDDYRNEIKFTDTLSNFEALLEDNTRSIRSAILVSNSYFFKTPLDLVFVNHDPERKFVENLIREENAEHISSWIKSTNQNFYSIAYTLTRGSHTTQHAFNPDFFIRIITPNMEYISVVEIKDDNDFSEENRAKLKYGREHFLELNKKLLDESVNQQYIFNILSPSSFSDYFAYMRDKRLLSNKFRSFLESELENE